MAMLTLEDKIKQQVQRAGRSLLDQLREVTNPQKPGRARMAVGELNDHHLLELYFWMLEGKTDHWLAKRILKWGYRPDRELNNWRKMVRAFRDRALPLLKNISSVRDKSVRRQLYKQKDRAKKVSEQIDALKVLQDTLSIQKQRAEMLMGLERELLMPTLPDADEDPALTEMKLHLREAWAAYFGPNAVNDALTSLARTADVTLDQERKLGIRDNQPSEATIHIQHKFQGFLEHVVSNEGQMLVEGVHNLFDEMEQRAVVMCLEDGGHWALEGEDETETEEADDD